MVAEPKVYQIVRFSKAGPNRVLRDRVTLTEAKAHCSKPSSAGPGWFDGYQRMPDSPCPGEEER